MYAIEFLQPIAFVNLQMLPLDKSAHSYNGFQYKSPSIIKTIRESVVLTLSVSVINIFCRTSNLTCCSDNFNYPFNLTNDNFATV